MRDGKIGSSADHSRSSMLRKAAASKLTRKKLPKNSLAAALGKLYGEVQKAGQLKAYDDVLDELLCYIERTIQLFWLSYKVGMFTAAKQRDSVIFRLFHQGKEHYQMTMIKLKHRLKVSSLILMQLGNEEDLVMKFK